MDDAERTMRVEALSELFIGYGHEAPKEKIKFYAVVTEWVPSEIFRASCLHAAAITKGSFPPGPGDIVGAALELAPPRSSVGQSATRPQWYQRMIRARRARK